MRHGRAGRKDAQFISSVRVVCWGVAIGAAVTVVLLLLLSYGFVIMKNIPHRAIAPLGIALGAAGAFFGGYASGRISKQKGMLFGVITALALFALLFLFGLILIKEPITTVSFIKMGVMLLLGAVGGILGVNKKTKIR